MQYHCIVTFSKMADDHKEVLGMVDVEDVLSNKDRPPLKNWIPEGTKGNMDKTYTPPETNIFPESQWLEVGR